LLLSPPFFHRVVVLHRSAHAVEIQDVKIF